MYDRGFTAEEARRIGDSLFVDWGMYDLEQFRIGLLVELKERTQNPTPEDIQAAAKMAIANLNDTPTCYTKPEPAPMFAEVDAMGSPRPPSMHDNAPRSK
jgi:hypothetical protein